MVKIIAVAYNGFTAFRCSSIETATELIKRHRPDMQKHMEIVTFDEEKYAKAGADVRKLCKHLKPPPKEIKGKRK
jgi:hypothetical protein